MLPSTDVAVLIATYNRARLLGETLDVLSGSSSGGYRWEVVVVDNNSTDDTGQVVAARQRTYPVPLRYQVETAQGRSAALNTGIAATTAPLLLFTDDDVRAAPGWLAAGTRALAKGADYVGGPVRPIWEAPPPRWLDLTRSDLWGTIAILDYGDEPFDFQERCRVPLGANMGVRRSLLRRVGTFRIDLGRNAGRRVLGQEVPELLTRARAAGLGGRYVPEMTVDHHVPAARLTRRYFRRWWFGKGYSKAVFEAMQPITELGLDLRAVPHLGGVPRFMLADAVRDAAGWLRAATGGHAEERMRRAMRLAYLLGYLRARGWRRPDYPDSSAVPPAVDRASSVAAGLL
jgi:glycosyltransferase involved in cell wall biosynthesis